MTFQGLQSSGPGGTTSVTAVRVAGSAEARGARVAFASGPPLPAGARGGTLTLRSHAAGWLAAGVVLGALLEQLAGRAPRPQEAIADSCSCAAGQLPEREPGTAPARP